MTKCCTWMNPWFTRDWKKCFKRRQKWLENTNVRCFHPRRHHPALSSTSHHLFSTSGRRSGAFYTRLKRRKITTAAARRSGSPPPSLPSLPASLGLTFTHCCIYFLPPVARQQTGKSITWRRQILRKSLQEEGDTSGRSSTKKKEKKNPMESLSLFFAHRQTTSSNVDFYMQYMFCRWFVHWLHWQKSE